MTTRVERLTPAGAGGVAVLGLIGPEACQRVERLAGTLPPVGQVSLARLQLEGDLLDEALITRRSEEHLELGLHGGPGLVSEVLEALGGVGDPCQKGVERTALDALAEAPCDRAARVLLDQARGALRRAVGEGAIPEGGWRSQYGRYRYLLEPATVVLAGPVNAGKSTLFNLLVGQERVNVSPEEGTTRDAITARARVGHHVVDLVDTAGDRILESPGPDTAVGVELRGQALGRALRARADLVLWLSDDGCAPPQGDAMRSLRTRADFDGGPGALSAVVRPEEAVEVVQAVLREELRLEVTDPWTQGTPVPPSQLVAEALDDALALPHGSDRDRALNLALGPAEPLPLP